MEEIGENDDIINEHKDNVISSDELKIQNDKNSQILEDIWQWYNRCRQTNDPPSK